mgnify:CR=1 FL=1
MLLLVVAALTALLPLLAVLQYRWLGEVSLGERERMKRTLDAGAGQFARDFDREMGNLYAAFTPGVLTDEGSGHAQLIAQYLRWRQTSTRPQLVDQIYQTSSDAGGNPVLFRLDRGDLKLVETPWPDRLSRLREEMLRENGADNAAESVLNQILKHRLPGIAPETKSVPVIRFTVGPIDGTIPALVLHYFPPPVKSGEFPRRPAYRIVTLDLAYIREQFIPELAGRYFDIGAHGDYLLTVLAGKNPVAPLFASEPGSPVEKGDVMVDFMRLPREEPDRFMIAGLSQSAALSEKNGANRRVAISVLQSEVRPAQRQIEAKTGIYARSLVTTGGEGAWRLVVKHRAGSLETAVASIRRRNLAISFGILILLGISIGFILISTRRAQMLAARQMEFVAGVTHELRTPLAVICSAAENLADGVVDNREQTRRYGGLIRDEGRRLTGMVEQVLEFAGAESGRKTSHLVPVSPETIIEDALDACRPVLTGYEVECRLDDALPQVAADLPALSRALQNLINNAIKYGGDSRWIGIRAYARGDELVIDVSDRGLGIPPAEQSRIFEPFYRGSEVVAAQIHGNGLGLSLVRRIVESHGGRISVASRPNEGATFSIRLPVASPQTVNKQAADQTNQGYEQTGFAG